jgi:AraC-like DNA-binding protein
MELFTPENSREYFLFVLGFILDQSWPAKAWVAGPGVGDNTDPDREIQIIPVSRITVVLRGEQRLDPMISGQQRTLHLQPGESLYWSPYSWNPMFWEKSYFNFGIVFSQAFIRFLVVDYPGGLPIQGATPWSWHTLHPINNAGLSIVQSLNSLAADKANDPELSRYLCLALLHCAVKHLSEDTGNPGDVRGKRTWQRALEHLDHHYMDPQISRDSVANAINVHPNYLSAVARRYGNGFHRTLERIRIGHANQLLAGRQLSLKEIAQLCGYSTYSYFIRSYRHSTGNTPGAVRQKNSTTV